MPFNEELANHELDLCVRSRRVDGDLWWYDTISKYMFPIAQVLRQGIDVNDFAGRDESELGVELGIKVHTPRCICEGSESWLTQERSRQYGLCW